MDRKSSIIIKRLKNRQQTEQPEKDLMSDHHFHNEDEL